MDKTKRNKIEKLIYDFLSIVDVNNDFKNRDYYEGLFASMDDVAFDKWAKDMGKTPENTITIHQMPWSSVNMKQLREGADFLKVPVEEYVYYRHFVKGEEVRTKYPVFTGYINIKRLQQLLSKKNQFTFDTKSTDYTTGEVTRKSRVHHISNSEVYMLLLQNNKEALKEFFGPRGSNLEQKKEMQNKISLDGWVSLKDMPKDTTKNEAINTLDMYIIASGLKSDLLFKSPNDFKTPFTKEQMRRNIAGRR